MDASAKGDMMRRAGCSHRDDNALVDMLIAEPSWESRFCNALEERTEGDKVAGATFEAAFYAKWGFIVASIGLVATIILGVGSMVVGIVGHR
jgi:hypothetical protein